ncbi:MAG TPA: double zinc ribbon domain-containing protein [Phycisphaerae bacterium]|nr:double zinc ribbon domain-containing protein [Phycisphaerae bacterium]
MLHIRPVDAFAAVRSGFFRVRDLITPRLCGACLAPMGHRGNALCCECWADLATRISGPYCRRCGEEPGPHLLIDDCCTACRDGRGGQVRFHRLIRVGRYDGVLRTLILRFKRAYVLDDLLGGLLGQAIVSGLAAERVDVWTPVPSHWRRRMERRFQPTALLADRALRALGKHPVALLTMKRYVSEFHAQPHMSFARRAAAIEGAFSMAKGVSVKGKTIGIIEDVMTTGATLAEAARTLRRAGASRAVVAVLAKSNRFAAPVATQGAG